ncbi:hypothetical protein [Streptomyces sp. NPDC097619]|uniref:hypothetical protein n=1 Tax=Streptomyces sp. NPDC097619 TaxID=3157228 RepID=UPI003320F21C
MTTQEQQAGPGQRPRALMRPGYDELASVIRHHGQKLLEQLPDKVRVMVFVPDGWTMPAAQDIAPAALGGPEARWDYEVAHVRAGGSFADACGEARELAVNCLLIPSLDSLAENMGVVAGAVAELTRSSICLGMMPPGLATPTT